MSVIYWERQNENGEKWRRWDGIDHEKKQKAKTVRTRPRMDAGKPLTKSRFEDL